MKARKALCLSRQRAFLRNNQKANRAPRITMKKMINA
jgi:hypothetical protein